ncbi:MAG TPA: hypothetical protein VNT77_06110, partial [Allosphingosinicella sp.]|nr:hypothetical protein [Allosphingosinicella sp.]
APAAPVSRGESDPAPRPKAVKAAAKAPAARRGNRGTAAAVPPAAVPAAAPAAHRIEVVELRTPAASPAPEALSAEKPVQFVVLETPAPGREFRVVRTHVRTAREMTPELKEKIEKLLAREIRLSSLRAPYAIHSSGTTGEKK